MVETNTYVIVSCYKTAPRISWNWSCTCVRHSFLFDKGSRKTYN